LILYQIIGAGADAGRRAVPVLHSVMGTDKVRPAELRPAG